jgi:hypothetical protein
MRLRITAKPKPKQKDYLIGALADFKVIDMDTGADLSGKIRSIEVHIARDDVATAKIEYYVSEVDLEGICLLIDKVEEQLNA